MSPKKTSSKVPYIELSKLDILTTSRAYNCPKIEKERKEKGQTYLDQPLRTRNRIIEDLPEILEDNSCANKADDVKCEGWRKAGFCREHEYVKINCQKACFRCGVAPCSNTASDRNCEAWAKGGACAKDYIAKKHCQKTCAQYCEGGTKPTQPPVPTNPPTNPPPTNPPTGGPTNPPTNPPVTSNPKPTQKPNPGGKVFMGVGILCEDKYPDRCPQWAKQGECESNPGWMYSNCLLSCPNAHCDKKPQKPDDTCADPLGIGYDGSGSFKLPDSAFSSPDHMSPGGGWEAAAMNARLYYRDDHDKKRIGAWCATSAQRDGDGRNFYMQVDLQQQKTVKYIATQGRDRYFEHVKAYSIKYSNNKQDWTDYSENGKVKVFDGSCDHFTPVLNKFTTPISARYIRVYPKNWNYPCMRMELFGC